jgi:ABC-type uncharacterized transport system auxiliary subunit
MRTINRFFIAVTAFAFFLSGCSITSSKPPYAVQLYMLEYHLDPAIGSSISRTLKIDRFAVAQIFNNTTMLRRPGSYQIEPYNYHRWRTNPGDMVTDFISRDFKETGLFKAVFTYRQQEETDFVLEGNVTEFLLSNDGSRWQVLLSIDVSLLDMSRTAINERVLFQKVYKASEPIEKEDPVLFAAGMSKATARISSLIVNDVYQAGVRRNSQSP